MNRVPWVLALLLAGGMAATIAVMAADAPAADQPAAPQPQMVRFVCHFIAFTPKDPAILKVDLGGGLHGIPRWVLPTVFTKPGAPLVAMEPDGYRLLKPLGDLAPEFGPLDALKGRDPKAVEELLTRLDDRWNYYVATLSNSGPMGILLKDLRILRVPLETAGGTAIGPADAYQFEVLFAVRVDRVVGGGRALLQMLRFFHGYGPGVGCTGGDTQERILGGPCLEGGGTSVIHPYKSAAGMHDRDVVLPGFQWVQTVDLGQWETPKGPEPN